MQKICCFGELLLRFSPALQGVWIDTATMPVFIGGAELNVATALANWNLPVAYCTALPDNALTQEIKQYIQQKNINTSNILSIGNRIGTYYLPQGADLKNSGVIYDRAHSSFFELKKKCLNWDEILKDVTWFHCSAISPALNRHVANVCIEGLKAAKKRNITTSIDLNYRAKLWQYGKKPSEVMPDLVQYCDVVMGNIWAARDLLGIPVSERITHNSQKLDYLAHAEVTSWGIKAKFPNCKVVANTFRFDMDANKGIHYYATLHKDGKLYQSPHFSTEKVVSKVGSGDCFMGGLIYGLMNKHASQNIIDFAAAAAFGKLQEDSDATTQTIEQVNAQLIMKKE
jgi:2-dehydro-3-deoxygluconokinase